MVSDVLQHGMIATTNAPKVTLEDVFRAVIELHALRIAEVYDVIVMTQEAWELVVTEMGILESGTVRPWFACRLMGIPVHRCNDADEARTRARDLARDGKKVLLIGAPGDPWFGRMLT